MRYLVYSFFCMLVLGCGDHKFNGDQELKIPLAGKEKALKFTAPKYINPTLTKEIPSDQNCSAEAIYALDVDKEFIKLTNDQPPINLLSGVSIRYTFGDNCPTNNKDSLSTYFGRWLEVQKANSSISIQDSIR